MLMFCVLSRSVFVIGIDLNRHHVQVDTKFCILSIQISKYFTGGECSASHFNNNIYVVLAVCTVCLTDSGCRCVWIIRSQTYVSGSDEDILNWTNCKDLRRIFYIYWKLEIQPFCFSVYRKTIHNILLIGKHVNIE